MLRGSRTQLAEIAGPMKGQTQSMMIKDAFAVVIAWQSLLVTVASCILDKSSRFVNFGAG
jgi:hypothetical protein